MTGTNLTLPLLSGEVSMDTDRGRGRSKAESPEDLTPDLLRFAAALVTLMAAIALGLVR